MNNRRHNEGSTLVELLVAASIMALIIGAIVAVIRTGSEIEMSDNHRRVARSILTTWFENEFMAENYLDIESGFAAPDPEKNQVVENDTLKFKYIDVVVNNREGTPVIGSLHINVTEDIMDLNTNNLPNTSLEDDLVPIYKADAKIFWRELSTESDFSDSITISKIITLTTDPQSE